MDTQSLGSDEDINVSVSLLSADELRLADKTLLLFLIYNKTRQVRDFVLGGETMSQHLTFYNPSLQLFFSFLFIIYYYQPFKRILKLARGINDLSISSSPLSHHGVCLSLLCCYLSVLICSFASPPSHQPPPSCLSLWI